jgi:aspartate aminotransferase-like enzyme
MTDMFIPGPTEVLPQVLAAMTHPQIGHRTQAMRDLVASVTPKLRTLLGAKGDVFLASCSATGMLEATLMNLASKRVLCLDNGSWSQMWGEIGVTLGLSVDRLEVPWGKAHDPDDVKKALATGKYDVVTCTWCETSTGALNPLPAIADVVRQFEGVMFCVDAVSALAATECRFDEWGIDVCVAGIQKAMALPPGFSIAAVSERALAVAKAKPHRGYYNDFLRFKANADKNETPSTPSTAHIFALDHQMTRMLDEGLANRFARHAAMATMIQDWARSRLSIFTDESCLSPGVSCIASSRAGGSIDLPRFVAAVERRGKQLGDGYAKLKSTTFRIGHFGDHQVTDCEALCAVMDEALREQRD